MIHVAIESGGTFQKTPLPAGTAIPPQAIWIDLVHPTPEEDRQVEAFIGAEIPTRAEMQELEESSRLYQKNNTLYMTADVIAGADSKRPMDASVAFILTERHFVTVRYHDPRPFETFCNRPQRLATSAPGNHALFVGLLEALVDRIADVLGGIETDLDAVSDRLFTDDDDAGRSAARDLRAVVRRLGTRAALIARLRESLIGLGRIVPYYRTVAKEGAAREHDPRLKTLERDIRSLTEYEGHQSAEISFLLDSTLGFINIEQNNIVRVFSIAAVLFLPPTLVANIYGMNFKNMPELDWSWGYPLALLAMAFAAAVPFLYCRRKGWL